MNISCLKQKITQLMEGLGTNEAGKLLNANEQSFSGISLIISPNRGYSRDTQQQISAQGVMLRFPLSTTFFRGQQFQAEIRFGYFQVGGYFCQSEVRKCKGPATFANMWFKTTTNQPWLKFYTGINSSKHFDSNFFCPKYKIISQRLRATFSKAYLKVNNQVWYINLVKTSFSTFFFLFPEWHRILGKGRLRYLVPPTTPELIIPLHGDLQWQVYSLLSQLH